EIDAVLGCLGEDFVLDDRAAERPPARRGPRTLEEAAEEHEADAVAQIVIAVQVGFFEVLDDEFAVQKQSANELRSKRAVAAGRGIRKEMKPPDPGNRTQRDVHRAGPVDAERKRIG